MRRFLFPLLALCPAAAQALSLSLPVACEIGRDCFVQNYVDHAGGSEYKDYACGRETYDKHSGTDIRVPSLREMGRGVNVLASADGVVRGVRDGMPDVGMHATPAAELKNRDCGNGVVIRHEDGYETQYCHLQKGSIGVRKGDGVSRGAVIGRIGYSGMAEFPHVHFEVRKGEARLDPFTGGTREDGVCDTPKTPLWNASARKALAYRHGDLLASGFTDRPPTAPEILAGEHRQETLSRTADALVFWAESIALRGGERITLSIVAPDGRELASQTYDYPKPKARVHAFVGRKLNARPHWEPGVYVGRYRLEREGKPLVERETRVRIDAAR